MKHPFEDGITLPISLDNRAETIMSYTNPTNDIYPSAGYVNGVWGWITYRICPETPMILDIAAIQYIYGANNNYKTGNDTYTFDPTKPFFKTIWDAGGVDTISVSNFSLSCKIDLTPGSYSSLHYPTPANTGGETTTYDGTNNLGIAFNCIIENAVGGAGNDTLIGNSANNSLDGGSGDDIMYGGDGDDIFDWDSSKRGGNDTFYGGKGNDTFVLDSIQDKVIENSNEGNDTVWVPFNYSIASLINIENLYGFGSNPMTLTGNINNNYLEGGTGNDILDGGDGVDTALFNDKYSECTITVNGLTCTVQTKTQGLDSLKNIEYLNFSDKVIAFSTLIVPPTYTLLSTKTNFDEGTSAVFNLITTNVAAGTLILYTISSVSASDILSGLLTGSVTISSSGTSVITIPIAADGITEGPETLVLTVNGISASVVINDTSKAINSPPLGTVTINGKIAQNEILTASNNLTDADGLGQITYLWRVSSDNKNWTDLSVGSTFKLSESEVGKYVLLNATYTDGKGNKENISSTATNPVLNVNDLPVGSVTITGNVKAGQIVAVSNNLSDADGMGAISYFWQSSSDGFTWAENGTGTTLSISDSQVGKYLRVKWYASDKVILLRPGPF